MGLLVLILMPAILFSTTDSALLGATGCASIVCPRVKAEMTDSFVQLVPKLVPSSSQVLSTLSGSLSDVNGASTWTCVYPDIDDCASSPCNSRQRCIDGERSFTCECKTGYAGLDCEKDINECWSNPCQNGATCVDKRNRYTCNCGPWLGGTHCQSRNVYVYTTLQRDIMNVDCGPDHGIHIDEAVYGRASNEYVCLENYTIPGGDCFYDVVPVMQELCEGKSSCVFEVSNDKFGDPCTNIPKYLFVGHQCLSQFSSRGGSINWLFPVNRIPDGRFKFLVGTNRDANVLLASQPSLYGHFVEIALFGSDNTTVAIRKDCITTTCPPNFTAPASFNRSVAFNGFWMKFSDGLYELGLSDQSESLIEWQDPSPFDVTYVGVSSGVGSGAEWMFHSEF